MPEVDKQAREQAVSPSEMSWMIREAIETHTAPLNHMYSITCEASWEILQYCQQELSGDHNLHKVVTLTGTTMRAQAASCEDYVRMV
jgi:hypothetical protein